MKTNAKRAAGQQIRRFNPVDGEFFLVSKGDGSLFEKAYHAHDARLISAAENLLEGAEAAEQCINDFLDVYKRDCSMQTLDLAVESLKSDALRLIKKALRKVRS